jgi:hypothetical protein
MEWNGMEVDTIGWWHDNDKFDVGITKTIGWTANDGKDPFELKMDNELEQTMESLTNKKVEQGRAELWLLKETK